MLKPLTPAQQAWVDALRSGEYKQTTMTLQDGDAFCCLGVACKVAEKHGVEIEYDEFNELSGDTLSDQVAVVNWLSLESVNCKLNQMNSKYLMSTFITNLNDSSGLTFNELADVIEWNADVLFKE